MARLFPANIFVAPQEAEGSKRVAIGEAPGLEEQASGKPFYGGAGRWLEFFYRKAGVDKAQVNLLNCIQCRPPNNVFPTDPEAKTYISKDDARKSVDHCLHHHVWPFLKSRKWDRVDLLGGKALENITGLKEGINKWRGSPLVIPELGDKPIAIATIHPAAIAREQSMLPAVINDLGKGLTPPPENYNLHPSLDEVRAFKSTEFAFDIETNWKWGGLTKITMVGLSDRLYHAIVVPFEGAYISELKRIFKNAKSAVGHNSIQFDLPLLKDNGIELGDECQTWDTMILQHLRFPDLPHDLEFVGSQFSSKPAWKDDKKNFELYCARDVDITLQCFRQLKPMIEQAGLMNLYKYVQVPLAKICHHMSSLGVRIDPSRIDEVRARVKSELQTEELLLPKSLQTQLVVVNKRHPAPVGTLGKGGKPVKFITKPETEEIIPWASSKQVGDYLYKELGLPEVHDLKTDKVSTGKMALDKLYNRTKNPAIRAIKNLRKMASMLNLFAKEEMKSKASAHTHYNVHGTSSGRLSSSDPNLQNLNPAARYLYVPHHTNWTLVACDYSGIENRLTAYFANDTDRMRKFLTIPDYSEHRYLASLMTGIPYEQIEKDNDKDAPYGRAKRVCHGSNYGMGAKKIANLYDIPFQDVKGLLDKWKKEIQITVAWQNQIAEKAKRDGYLTTPFGRKRWFYTSSYYTESLSFLPQSTAADVIFRAMLGLMYERINWPLEKVQQVVGYVEPLLRPCNLLLQTHDELLFECPNEMVPQVVGIVKRVMEQPFRELGGLGLPVGIETGPSWGEMEKYKGPII